MANIIIHGSRYVKGGYKNNEWNPQRKDFLHKRRKELESDLKQTIFSRDKMNMRDCKTEADEEKRTAEYDAWRTYKDKTGKTNEDKMREWSEVNREFKKYGEEGRRHDVDQIRDNKVKYD